MIVDRLKDITFRSQKRNYIGVSQIGDTCERKLWRDYKDPIVEEYGYQQHDIFERGHWEEGRIFEHLKRIDIRLEQTQVDCEYLALKGHADAIIQDLRDGKRYLLEIKTMKQELFNALVKKGVKKANFQYWVQCQAYMGLLGLDQSILLVRNKNTEALYEEFIDFDKESYRLHLEKAARIERAKKAPLGYTIMNKPNLLCTWCKYNPECWA